MCGKTFYCVLQSSWLGGSLGCALDCLAAAGASFAPCQRALRQRIRSAPSRTGRATFARFGCRHSRVFLSPLSAGAQLECPGHPAHFLKVGNHFSVRLIHSCCTVLLMRPYPFAVCGLLVSCSCCTLSLFSLFFIKFCCYRKTTG